MELSWAACMFVIALYRAMKQTPGTEHAGLMDSVESMIVHDLRGKAYRVDAWLNYLAHYLDGRPIFLLKQDDFFINLDTLAPGIGGYAFIVVVFSDHIEWYALSAMSRTPSQRYAIEFEARGTLDGQWSYERPSLTALEAALDSQLNLNLEFCKNSTDMYAPATLAMYEKAMRRLQGVDSWVPNVLTFPDNFTPIERRMLSAACSIDTVIRMGTIRDCFSEGMTDDLVKTVWLTHQAAINGDSFKIE